MESLLKTIADMNVEFNTRMVEFETRDRLQKEGSSSASSVNLQAEFTTFKKFVLKALGDIQKQVQFLAQSADNVETRSRRKILLIHGVPEQKNEDIPLVVSKIIEEKCKVSSFSPTCIKRSQRRGRVTSPNKPRPILVKFQQATTRDVVWFAKTNLKGTGVTISEFLTKARHDVFMSARQRFGITRCWTREGIIYVMGSGNKRHRITTLAELDTVCDDGMKPAAVAKASVIKTRRTAKK